MFKYDVPASANGTGMAEMKRLAGSVPEDMKGVVKSLPDVTIYDIDGELDKLGAGTFSKGKTKYALMAGATAVFVFITCFVERMRQPRKKASEQVLNFQNIHINL